MKINKEMLREISSKSDAELWATIRSIAERYGLQLPEGTPPKEELARLRAVLSSEEKINLGSAVDILNKYRRGRK